MPRLDLEAMGAEVIDSVRGFTERAVAPVRGKVEALERDVGSLPSADFVRAEIATARSQLMLDLLATMAQSKDGKSISVEDVTPLVEKLVGALPVPKDGENGRDGKDGADGKSVEPAEVAALVEDAVARAHASHDADVKALGDAIAYRFTAATI